MASLSEKQIRPIRGQRRGLFSGIQYRSRGGDFRQLYNGVTSNTEPVHLCLTSPPYPLRKQRDYAAAFKNDSDYIDFIVEAIRPIARQLVNGGSVVLNIGQIF